MAANSSIILSNIDFDTHKNTLKQYLRSQTRFQDYDFEGSNMNVLLDILSYNTYHNMFYLNMVSSEMFLDTAQIRDSVVSHAKELNYTPRSFKSAEANVNIVVTTSDTTKRSIPVARGTSFTSRYSNRNFTFTLNDSVVISDYTINGNDTITFVGSNIPIYEGYFINDTFTYTADTTQRFIITNRNCDISSISINVIEDVGATIQTYTRATSLFNVNDKSKVFFVQPCENDSYEVVFGDGVSGRPPKDNSVVSVEYRISNGQLPNGSNAFRADTTIDGETNILITVNSPASMGSVSESIEEIKYNAPRHFTTQERAVTTEDYENLLKLNFSEVNAVSAYGGEDLNPPQFGKVFVAVDLKEVDGVPEVKKDQYYRFLKPRSPVSIDPVFVNPVYTYIGVTSTVKYNINVTKLSAQDIRTLVVSNITKYALNNLNNFNKVFRYSNIVEAIDNTQQAIISNETSIKVIKIITPTLGINNNIDVDFQIPLDTTQSTARGGYAVSSSRFIYGGSRATLQDSGNGVLNIVASSGEVITNIGTVDYETGLVQISNLNVSQYDGAGIKIRVEPRNKDVQVINNVILNIVDDDIAVTVQGVSQ
tara:strand:- start:8787 stop:10568 length:1782 start_codon:yes stop_codon:yes gene_type:complete